jgi:hypothetical protein
VLGLPRSARLAAWGNAWLGGDATLAQLVAAVRGDDEPHHVRWPAGGPPDPPADLSGTLAGAPAAGADGFRLVLVAPGHPAPGTGSGPFGAAATDAGEAVLAVRRGLPEQAVAGLVPRVEAFGPPGDRGHLVTWDAFELAGAVVAAGLGPATLAEADRALTEGLLATTGTLQALDVARWRPEIGQLLDDVRSRRDEAVLPAPYERRAQLVAARAVRLLAIVELAGSDDGGSLTSHAAEGRRQALQPLAVAARDALVAACGSVLEPVSR